MSSPTHSSSHSAPFDLSAWRNVPTVLMVLGGAGALLGAFLDVKHAAFSYLTAYMFFLSFGLGGLILTILHHLFDASWSVPVRRINEHLANLLPMLALLFLPIIIAYTSWVYRVMRGPVRETDITQAKSSYY